MANMSFKSETAKLRMSRIEVLLKQSPMNKHELATELCISTRWAGGYLSHMHKQGLIRVCSWTRHIGEPTPRYELGSAPDTARPKPMTPAQIAKRYRKKVKADPELAIKYLSKKKAYNTKPRKMDIAAAWLFNPLPKAEE